MTRLAKAQPPREAARATSIVSVQSERTQALLDEKVRRVQELRHAVNVSMWALGGALSDIHVSRSWEARHGSFAGFCVGEIKMSAASVHRLIGIFCRFTEEQTRLYGTSRLYMVTMSPKGYWPELLALCEAGATCKDLRARVGEIRAEERKSGRGSPLVVRRVASDKDTSAATIAAMEKREAGRALLPESATPAAKVLPQAWSIALFAKKSPGGGPAKHARSIAQQPRGELSIPGVGTISISLFEGDGGAICVDAKLRPEGAL